MKIKHILAIDLHLFDGEGAAAQAAGGGGATDVAVQGTTPAQPEGQSPEQVQPEAKQASQRERRRAYRELISGEYKDLYTEDTQRIINRKARENGELREQVGRYQPVIDLLTQRYGIWDGDMEKLAAAIENDNAYWTRAAEEAGMSVEQFKQYQQLQRDNARLLREQQDRVGRDAAMRQMQRWDSEANQAKALYPGLDFETEAQNPQFVSMLRAGVPVQTAYEVLHMEEIKAGIAAAQAKATERQVVDGIRARGARPQENGTTAQSAFTVKTDVRSMTREERAEIIRRVARGERIVL